MKRFIILLVIGAAALSAHRTYGSPEAQAVDAAAAAKLGSVVAEVGRVARAKEIMGDVGARVVGPAVRSMMRDTQRLLAELEPAIARAKPAEARRAHELTKKIAEYDSAAVRSLRDGAPMAAIRYAVRGKGMIPSVRQVVAEENAFR